jgi:hypothetical protein
MGITHVGRCVRTEVEEELKESEQNDECWFAERMELARKNSH